MRAITFYSRGSVGYSSSLSFSLFSVSLCSLFFFLSSDFILVPFRTLSIFYLFPSDIFTSPQLLSFLIIYTSNIDELFNRLAADMASQPETETLGQVCIMPYSPQYVNSSFSLFFVSFLGRPQPPPPGVQL